MVSLEKKQVKVFPSLLAANCCEIGITGDHLLKSGADGFHVDIMDGHFVPNLSFGPKLVSDLRARYNQVYLDVHLMISPVNHFIDAFAKAGANSLSIHPEACSALKESLIRIKDYGCDTGVVLNPETSIDAIEGVLDTVDFVLVMSVVPGFGGQSFMPSSLEKIRQLRQMGFLKDIAIDGGIGVDQARDVIDAGANILITGTGLLKHKPEDFSSVIHAMKR